MKLNFQIFSTTKITNLVLKEYEDHKNSAKIKNFLLKN